MFTAGAGSSIEATAFNLYNKSIKCLFTTAFHPEKLRLRESEYLVQSHVKTTGLVCLQTPGFSTTVLPLIYKTTKPTT